MYITGNRDLETIYIQLSNVYSVMNNIKPWTMVLPLQIYPCFFA